MHYYAGFIDLFVPFCLGLNCCRGNRLVSSVHERTIECNNCICNGYGYALRHIIELFSASGMCALILQTQGFLV